MSNRNFSFTNASFTHVLFVAAAIAAMGCALVIFGCVLEAQCHLDLLRESGQAALDAYLARVDSHQLSLAAFMVESVSGHCYAHGALLQGVGFWFVFALAPVSAALLSIVRLAGPREKSASLRLCIAPSR